MSADKKSAKAIAPGEATMTLRVIRKNGEVEQHEGAPVEIALPVELVTEYRALKKRLSEVESLLLECAMNQGA